MYRSKNDPSLNDLSLNDPSASMLALQYVNSTTTTTTVTTMITATVARGLLLAENLILC